MGEVAGGCDGRGPAYLYLWVFNIYGYSMAVSPFDRLRGGKGGIVEECRYTITKPIIASERKCCTEEISVPRTRDSVRRASDFVQIAITLRTRSERYGLISSVKIPVTDFPLHLECENDRRTEAANRVSIERAQSSGRIRGSEGNLGGRG